LIRRLCAFLCGLLALPALAYTDTHATWWTGTTVYYDTVEAACRAIVETSTGRIFDSVQNMSGAMPTRTAQCYGHTGTNAPAYVNSVSESCAGQTGWTQNATYGCVKTVSTCPAPKTPDVNGVCQNPACSASGTVMGTADSMYEITGGTLTSSVCINSCTYKATGGGGSALGHSFVWGPFVSTGAACSGQVGTTPPSSTTPTQSPTPLAPGTCSGQVNGATVVVPCGSGIADGPSQSASSSTTGSGAASSTATGTGSTTTCTNGVCTTTTTTTTTTTGGTSSGTTTSTGTTTQSQSDYCAANKGSKLCASDDTTKSFSGSCSSTACSGDAIECAIAQEQAKRWCQVMDDAPSSNAAVQAANGQSQPSDHPGNASNVTTTPLGTFDQTDLIGSSCPGDRTFAVGGAFPAVVLPLSKLCTPASWLGNFIVGLTALACIGIVFVGKAGGG